ncbi:MAG: hypothetical protein ACRC91_11150 [Aeromonas sp.]
MRNFVKVVNIEGTAGERAPGGQSWIDFWRENCANVELFDEVCCRSGCRNAAEHGAHVRVLGPGVLLEAMEFIVPLCAGCNNPENTDDFDVLDHFLVIVPS